MESRYYNALVSDIKGKERSMYKAMRPTSRLTLSGCQFFFDFDNTITPFDVLDEIIKKFSINREWVAYEEAWQKGEIGSRECLEKQLRLVRVTKENLLRYLSTVKIDSYFLRLLALLKKEGIAPIILSDSFSFIIEHILRSNGIKDLAVHANTLRFDGDRLTPLFPHTNASCLQCANCKKMHLHDKALRGKIIVYIGDGLSDVCAAQSADVVFAKEALLRHFRKTKRRCVEFRDLGDIYDRFKREEA